MPQVADAVFDAEALRDDFADAWRRPKLRRKSCRQGARHDDLAKFAFLLGIELPRPTQLAAFERILAACVSLTAVMEPPMIGVMEPV